MVRLGYIDPSHVPDGFMDNMNTFGRAASLSISSRLSIINRPQHYAVDSTSMQLSLHESIEVVQNMTNGNQTSLTKTSTFLRTLSQTSEQIERKPKKMKSVKSKIDDCNSIEMKEISTSPKVKKKPKKYKNRNPTVVLSPILVKSQSAENTGTIAPTLSALDTLSPMTS